MSDNRYMNAITQGVYVIGSKLGDKKNLMTAAWLTQISSRPNQILVVVASSHYTAEILQKEPLFSISVLAKGQEEEAVACGRISGRKTDKTKQEFCGEDADGLPYIKDAAAYLCCEVKAVFQAGDHHLFAAEVLSGETCGREPMRYDADKFF